MKIKGIYFLYRFLQVLGFPLLLLYLLFRSRRNRPYFTSLRQRFGFLPRSFQQTVAGAIWLHAVSAGEVIAVTELTRRIRSQFPRAPLFVSTATLAGHSTAHERLGNVASGIFYAPLDYVFSVRKVLRTLRPSIVVIVETEIWPNLFHEVKRSGSGLLIVNGRISDEALARYRKLRWFFAEALRWPDLIYVQSGIMRERYIDVGAPPENIRVGGNLKYDVPPTRFGVSSRVQMLLDQARPTRVWIAASTMAAAGGSRPYPDFDEDDLVIEAFHQLSAHHPRLLLIIAPRRPERFDVVAQKLKNAKIRFLRRTLVGNGDQLSLPGVLLLDTIGELAAVFSRASVVFMGGTLAARGGHNVLEPALAGRPIVSGPHMENFHEIAEDFRAKGAYVEVGQRPGLSEKQMAAELARAVASLVGDARRAEDLGRRALDCAQARRGASSQALDAIQELYSSTLPCFRPDLLDCIMFWPLSRIWLYGGRVKRLRDYRRRKQLDATVISVGNITMGGTGKTPMVVYLAEQMKRAGHQPGILTRGYGRQSLHKNIVLEPGAEAPVAQSGDEAQIYLRAGVAPIGIGADRFEAGGMLRRQTGAAVIIMDDGFQHFLLERQLDIVLIDALDPFDACEVFPLGRLRESLAGLQRAHLLVITRSENGHALPAIEARLRQYNSEAPIFHASVVPEYWVELTTGAQIPLDELAPLRLAGFCGLGNPESFWSTLLHMGIQIVDCVEFGDHHSYRPREVRLLKEQFRTAQAEAVVTTEKDAVNLCDSAAQLLSPLRLYWLKVRTEIEEEAEFLSAVEHHLAAFK